MTDISARDSKSAPEKKTNSFNRRFESTKTGIIGLQRDSMMENELHLLVNLMILISLYSLYIPIFNSQN